jgi:hypothetical protein
MGEDNCPSEVSDPFLHRTRTRTVLSATRPPALSIRSNGFA